MSLGEIVQLLTLATLVLGIGGAIWRSGGNSKKQESFLFALSQDFKALKDEVRELSKITIKLVEHTGRMDRQDDRITNLAKRVDDRIADSDRRFMEHSDAINQMRRGEGFILPLHKSPFEIGQKRV